MSIDYNSLGIGSGADGYGNGGYGAGEGFSGSLYGGDPSTSGGIMSPGGPGQSGPIQVDPQGGGGMRPGEGIHQRPAGGMSGQQQMGGLKPFLSQLLGFSPQGGQRMGGGPRRIGQNPRMQPPIVRSPVMRPQPRGGGISSPGGPRLMQPPIQRAPGGGPVQGRPLPGRPQPRPVPGGIPGQGMNRMTPYKPGGPGQQLQQ